MQRYGTAPRKQESAMKYWAYVNNEILGPFEKEKLLELPSFSPSLLVCPQTPVGEKTEDWKEAATYPELSALIASGSGLSHASAAPETAPQQHEPPAQKTSAIEPSAHTFKSLTASSIDPVPPSDHGLAGINISSNKLGKAHAEPAPGAGSPSQGSAFDPISLSTIMRRTETLSGQDSREGEIAKEPSAAFSQAEPAPAGHLAGLEISAITHQNEPETPAFSAPAPAEEQPAAPAPQERTPAFSPSSAAAEPLAAQPAGAAVADTAALNALVNRLDAISKAAVTRHDISSAVDPLRLKLDQMGEVLSAIKNSQFQREVMDKLNYLEGAIAEMKSSVKNLQSAPRPAAEPVPLKMERASDVFMGVQPPPKEAPKADPAKETAKPAEMVDQGSKTSKFKLGPLFKKAFKAILTIVLLIAVLLGAVIGLNKFGIFDATKFIPFPLPFTGGAAQQASEQASQEQQSAATQPQQAAQTGAQQAQPQGAPQGLAQGAQQSQNSQQQAQPQGAEPQQQPQEQAQKEPDHSPEVIYFTRTFKLKPAGPSLEDKIYAEAAKSGGNYNRTSWKVKPPVQGAYEIAAVIPSKAGNLYYTFTVNLDQKTLQPADDTGKAAFSSLAAAKAKRKAGRQKAVKQPPRQQPQKAASTKPAAANEGEYEYVYEEDDGTGK